MVHPSMPVVLLPAVVLGMVGLAVVVASSRLAVSLAPSVRRYPRVTALVSRSAPWLAAGVGLAGVLLFAASDPLFHYVEREDFIVEWSSAVLYFLAAAVAAQVIRGAGQTLGVRTIIAGLAGFMFLSGMEEASWFQRVFGFATPHFLAANAQHEANLHNLDSADFEVLFFVILCAAFLGAPLVARILGSKAPPVLAALTPSREVVLVAVCALALVDVRGPRAGVYLGLLVAAAAVTAALLVRALREGDLATVALLGFVAALFVATQVVSALIRNAFGEFSELLAAEAYALYAVELYVRFRGSGRRLGITTSAVVAVMVVLRIAQQIRIHW